MGLYSMGCIYEGGGGFIQDVNWVTYLGWGGLFRGGGVGLINRILRYLSGILKL